MAPSYQRQCNLWNERTFWHEIILKVYIIPTFGYSFRVYRSAKSIGIKLLKLSHARMFSHSKDYIAFDTREPSYSLFPYFL